MHKIIFRAGSFLISRNFRLILNNSDQRLLLTRDSSKNSYVNRSISLDNKKMSNESGASSSTKSTVTSSSSTPTDKNSHKFTNRLINEKSPYLLQHAHNPVDWYPWCDEAIQRAKDENKMIFLSVGYSTCHWCHVMEHESFENEEIAKIMNENFINIKVDREERPDIDKIYMNFLITTTGNGGWPMNVWLAPDLSPITAGSYFPPVDKWSCPSFKNVITRMSIEWKVNQKKCCETGNTIIQAIAKSITEINDSDYAERDQTTPEAQLDLAVKIYKGNFDKLYGGFGSAPKFHQVPILNFLFHAYTLKKSKEIINIVLTTLNKIGNGGIHDHIFGGFARYSVDKNWHIPHFEKMLYDQGQLLSAYANAYKITKNQYYLDIADGIFRYLVKDLRHPSGGFYSGEDADSLPTANDNKKVEGAFYAWTYSEIRNEFEKNADKFEKENDIKFDWKKIFEIYCYHYDVQETGNIKPSSDPFGHLTGKNILIVNESLKNTANKFDINIDKLKNLLKIGNNILHEVRDKRPRPHLDTKIITSWNGLVLSGLAKISMSCTEKREEYIKAAKNLITFLKTNSYDEEKKLLLRSCYGKGTDNDSTEILSEPIFGFLDDYAFLIKGLLDYYKATLDLKALEWAKDLQDTQDRLFWDNKWGGYFYTQEDSPNLVVRLKEDHDGAEPCGNSVSARNLILISAYFEEPEYKIKAKKLLEFFGKIHHPMGSVFPEMFSALLLIDRGLEMTAVVGPDCDKTNKFLDICRRYYIPGMIAVHFDIDNPSLVKRKTAEKFKMINDQPTVYICHNKACQLPITDPLKLEEIFESKYLLTQESDNTKADGSD